MPDPLCPAKHKTTRTTRDSETGAPKLIECLTCGTTWTVIRREGTLDSWADDRSSIGPDVI